MIKTINNSANTPRNYSVPSMAKYGRARTPKSIIADLLFTIIFCTVIALLITIFTSRAYIMINFVMSFSVGLSIFLIAISLHVMIKPQNILHLTFIYFIAFGGGVFIGTQTGPWILQRYFSISMPWPNSYLRFMMISVIAGGAATYFFYSLMRMKHSRRMIEEERISRMTLEKDALAAKLKMLQAQIEPHFLFNTLSNVVSLIDTQPARGKAMLLDLTKYLRISLSRTLPEKTTMGQEIEMLKAYLNIQKIRMGERLNFIIDVPEYLYPLALPPMLLQPLVENAIKHGLEPKVEGGEIRIAAAAEHNLLRIEVRDTGIGFSDYHQSGVGLANVRERLELLFGEKGKLLLEENHPSGVKAAIEVHIDD